MATRKRACIKRGKHNKCLKRAGSASRKHSTRRCRHQSGRLKGKFKKCGR